MISQTGFITRGDPDWFECVGREFIMGALRFCCHNKPITARIIGMMIWAPLYGAFSVAALLYRIVFMSILITSLAALDIIEPFSIAWKRMKS